MMLLSTIIEWFQRCLTSSIFITTSRNTINAMSIATTYDHKE